MPRISGAPSVDFSVAAEPGPPDPIPPAGDNTITLTNRTGAAVANYPLMFGRPFRPGEVLGVPSVLLDGAPLPTQADVKNRHPDGSAAFAVLAVVVPDLPADTPVVLAVVDGGAKRWPRHRVRAPDGFDAVVSLSSDTTPAQQVSLVDALKRKLAQAWAIGEVAQSVTIADDSADRQLDFGFGDGYRPLRLRGGFTFWHATGQIQVRVTGEAGLTTELEDVAYQFSIALGTEGDLQEVYQADLSDSKRHWMMSRWTRTFWWPTAPPREIDIDYNLAYLISTGWLPHYNTAITLDPAAITSEYAFWTDRPHDIYDGQWNGGYWQNGMGVSGDRQEIGPFPTWDIMSLYSGDWRLREMARGMSDLAAAFPGNLREGEPSFRLCRGDPPGTALGRAMSITDRETMLYSVLDYAYTKPEDRVTIVGPRASQPWSFDCAHQPQPWFVPYMLTGDPFYLDSAYLWAATSASFANGAATTQPYGRGPTGAEGVIADQLRGGGWMLRGRVETALMAPDAAPEKAYLRQLLSDGIARWEGGFGITGTELDGDPSKNWGTTYGNYYSNNNGPCSRQPPALGNWESAGYPNGQDATIVNNQNNGIYVPGKVGSFTAPWMQYYVLYCLGRALDLGCPTGPLLERAGAWLIGIILSTGYPHLVAQYQMPVEKAATVGSSNQLTGGGFFDWPGLVAALQPAWLTGEGWVPPNSSCTSLPQYWAQNLHADGRQIWALPGASYLLDQPGGAEAWAWLETNIIEPVGRSRTTFAQEPRWAIIPRADT